MMFQMDKQTGKIIDYVMVDFQVLRYNNAVNDLAYYLFTSVKPEVRQAQLKALLQHYLSILNIVTLELGHPIDLSYDVSVTLKFNPELSNIFYSQKYLPGSNM